MVKVGDKVRVVNAWHSGGQYKKGDVLTVEQVLGNSIITKEASRLLVSSEYELYEPIKVGDTVTLIDNFYNHEKFKSEPRNQRKDIAKLKGKTFRFSILSILGDRAGHDTDCPWTIPLELLRKVDDRTLKTGVLDEKPKKGDLFRVIGNTTPHHYYKIGDVVEFCQLLKSGEYACISVDSQRYQHISPCDLKPYDGIHRHTPEQVAEAQRIIGEIVAGFTDGECFFICDESDKELSIRYTAEVADDMPTITAHCSPHDEFNRTIGIMVALCKATGRKLPDWV